MTDPIRLDDVALEQLRIHQAEVARIRDELDDRVESHDLLDEAVQAIEETIDEETVEWKGEQNPQGESSTSVDDWE